MLRASQRSLFSIPRLLVKLVAVPLCCIRWYCPSSLDSPPSIVLASLLSVSSFSPFAFHAAETSRRWIVSYEGAITYTQRDRIVLSRYGAFIFISQFVLFSIFGWALEVYLKELAAEDRIALSGGDIWRYIRFVSIVFPFSSYA